MNTKGQQTDRKEENLIEEIESLTIHGVSKIFSSKSRLLRFMWAAFCISTFAALIFYTGESITKYIRREIYINEEKIQKGDMILPAITLCNTNRYLIKNVYPVDQNLPKNCSYTGREYFKNEINQEYFKQACHWFSAFHPSKNYTIAKVGEYTATNIQFPEHFSFLPHFWPCFTLNRNQMLQQDTDGEEGGLNMIISFDENDRIDDGFFDILIDKKRGLSVAVHDPREIIPAISDIYLPTGFHTSIAIKKIKTERLPAPYPSKCVNSGNEIPEKIIPGKLNVKTCLLSCFCRAVYDNCGGTFPTFRAFMSEEKYPKTLNITKSSISCFSLSWIEKDGCNCRFPCEEEVYETKINRTPWPQEWQKEALHRLLFRNETYDENAAKSIKKRSLKLSVYYSELYEYRYTEVEKYGFSSVLGDFGGKMGLFIGASILSFVEVFIILGKFIKSSFSKKVDAAKQ